MFNKHDSFTKAFNYVADRLEKAKKGMEKHEKEVNTKDSAIEFYRSVIDDPNATINEKLKSQERLDDILGHKHISHEGSAQELADEINSFIQEAENFGSPKAVEDGGINDAATN